jgi:hypothetical protein
MRETIVTLFITLAFFFRIGVLAPAYAQEQLKIVGMSIACSNDRVYTWYDDQTVSIGTSENLSAYEPPHRYSLPFGKTPADILEIGIASDDRVYTWYRDLTVSVGMSTDLDKYQPRHQYRLPKFTSLEDVVGIDIACSNDHVYVWFGSGRVASGTSDDLDKYSSARPAFLRNPRGVLGMGIAKNDHVYAWFSDRTASSGTSTRIVEYREKYEYVTGPGPCDIRADPPKRGDKFVFGIGTRGPECKSSAVVYVRLKEKLLNGDRTIVEGRKSGSNFEFPLPYACTGHREKTLFTEVITVGRTVRSPETKITDCF